jgi:hypothetical protein
VGCGSNSRPLDPDGYGTLGVGTGEVEIGWGYTVDGKEVEVLGTRINVNLDVGENYAEDSYEDQPRSEREFHQVVQ